MKQQGRAMLSGAQRRAQLRSRIGKGRLVVAPGVFEMISATVADRMGFDALYMTGYGTVASYLGLPDAGLASYADMVNRVQQFASITTTPCAGMRLPVPAPSRSRTRNSPRNAATCWAAGSSLPS
jgi:hypothetical protein